MTKTMVLLAAGCLVSTDSVSAAQPDRWEADIQKFEQKIADGTAKAGSVLFIGSSSIRMWDLSESFPDHQTVNHGFGGSQVSDSVQYFDRIVKPLQPSMILMYAGDNDIAKGKSPEDVFVDFLKFVQRVKADLPTGTKVGFVAIKPSLKRWHLAELNTAANSMIARHCRDDDQLSYVDVWTPMLGADGTPRPELFIKDGLHLNAEGYRLWTSLVKPMLPAAE